VDGTDEPAVVNLMNEVEDELGPIGVAIYNASQRVVKSILEMESAEFEGAWRVSCLGAMIVGREAARRMVPRGHGSILFTGATASLRGGNGFAAFAAGKFGLRALAQSMARELGPQGIHVAHFVIDGGIDNERTRERAPERVDEDGLLSPDAIAEAYYQTHAQHRSAWSQEVDLRPWREKF
jgi:NAD(P)-dependent dehydrogenase (short-subunit alcohol dehydrogenase family)